MKAKVLPASSTTRSSSLRTTTDIILPMSHTATDDYMQQIVSRQKDHEFRRRRFPSTVTRVWFYETAPTSAITYMCEIDPPRTRTATGTPLETNGHGNAEFNTFHPDWEGYDYAYRVRSCSCLRIPITLEMLKSRFGFGSAPRGMVYVTKDMAACYSSPDAVEELWRDKA